MGAFFTFEISKIHFFIKTKKLLLWKWFRVTCLYYKALEQTLGGKNSKYRQNRVK